MVEMQMGPMIDMVFLLLVFFMVTAKPVKDEADISIGLPGAVSQEETLDIPDEQRIVIQETWTGGAERPAAWTPRLSRGLPELVGVLKRFKEVLRQRQSRRRWSRWYLPIRRASTSALSMSSMPARLAEINGVTFDSVNVSGDGGG